MESHQSKPSSLRLKRYIGDKENFQTVGKKRDGLHLRNREDKSRKFNMGVV